MSALVVLSMAPIGSLLFQQMGWQFTGFNSLAVGAAAGGAVGYQFSDQILAQVSSSKLVYAGSVSFALVFSPMVGLGSSPVMSVGVGLGLGYLIVNYLIPDVVALEDYLSKGQMLLNDAAALDSFVKKF
jgi:hypothetical protein